MKILKLPAVALFFGVFSLNAQANNKSVDVASQIEQNISTSSQLLGLSEETYKYANDQFLRLHFRTLNPDIPLITEMPEFKSPENYSQRELNEAMNIQKAKFASLLGLPVASLDYFLEHMSAVYKSDLFSGKVIIENALTVSDMETITVTCDLRCDESPFSGLELNIYSKGLDAGIGQYAEFKVDFVQNSTNQKLASQVWSYNNYSGAWKVADICQDGAKGSLC